MEVDKLKNWLDLTKQHATEHFWREVFSHESKSYPCSGPFPQDLSPSRGAVSKDPFPHCDLYEYEDRLFIEAELPGVTREQVRITLKGKHLAISGEYSTLKPRITYYLKERCDRSFEKNINLPYQVNQHGIKSSLEKGLLTIVLPIIKEEEAVPVHIECNAPVSGPRQLLD